MKYRCPHCGQPGFSFVEKIDMVPRWITPEYFQGVRCGYCREKAVYYARWGGRIVHVAVQVALGLALAGFWIWALTHLPEEMLAGNELEPFLGYIILPMLVWGASVSVFKWLFCYLDKPARADYISADKFRFTTDGTTRLWPRVRVGEIYLFRFPTRKKKEDGPYLIGMVTKVEKDGAQKVVTVRVVKEYLMTAPLLDEELVLTTEKGFSVSGVTSHTYRLPPEEE